MSAAPHYPDPATRRLVTVSVLAAAVMTALDTTILNVALPHIQASVSASPDEMTWVLTSYIVAVAIATPLSGWIADRFGRKRLMLAAVVGFTAASALCGLATGFEELVAFRLVQGVFAAPLMPMSQAILFDINPPERHASAMAYFAMGAVLAPIFGPVLGAWLTDDFSWRWVFYINLPIGVLAFIGLSNFLEETRAATASRFDLTGFALLALAIALLQLMLDRGQKLDWFDSTEICVEGALALFFFYAFAVHSALTPDPFVRPALFMDRNYAIGLFVSFLVGLLVFSVTSLLPIMLQNLMRYPVLLTGLLGAPRGVGSFLLMFLVSTLVRWIDERLLVMAGFLLMALSLWGMAGFSLGMDTHIVLISGFLAGAGNGLAFVPLSTMAFSTLAPALRNQASAMYNLIRNMGAAVGISILQVMTVRNTAVVHARLTEGVRPDNPVLALREPGFDFGAPGLVAAMDARITREAGMVAYIDAYWLLAMLTVVALPLIFLMRPPRKGRRDAEPLSVHLE